MFPIPPADLKNQKGIKMKNNIYIFDFGNQIKIGQSSNVKQRLRNIETQSGREAVNKFDIKADQRYENLLHKILSEYRTIGEYFNFNFDIAVSILKSLVRNDFIKDIKPDSQLFTPLINDNSITGIMIVSPSGMTISEMVKALGLERKTIEMRLLRGGHKPISYEATYSLEAFEDIKKPRSRGRPKKPKPQP